MSSNRRAASAHRPGTATGWVTRFVRLVALTCLLMLHGRAPAAPAPLLSDYTHTAWGALQGGPVDVLKMTQTDDGWLWVATEIGLYRFDGVTFERADTVYGHPLASNNVLGLLAGADGALWVGYRFGGVTVFRKDGARSYFENDGLPGGAVFHIAAAPDGTVWVAARDGVASLAPGATRFQAQGSAVGLPAKRMFQILFARDGTQWIACLDGVFFRRPGEKRFAQAWPRMTLMSMAEAPDGTIWASDTASRFYRVRTSAPAGGDVPKPELAATGIQFDRSGQMWLMQLDGVERKLDVRAAPVPAQRLSQTNGLSGPLPQTFFQDREGTIWIGTAAGLDRLRRNRLKPLPVDREFDHPGMAQGPDGDVWIGDFYGDVHSFGPDGVKKPVAKGHFAASYRAPDGVLWIADDQSLRRHAPDGSTTVVPLPPGARGFDPQALQQDADGGLWASFSGAVLFRLAHGEWQKYGGLSGFAGGLVMTMALDGQGTLWMGHTGNAITLVTRGPRGPSVRQLGDAAGLQLGAVLHLHPDGATMWAGGERGTMLYRDGRFAALRGVGGETFRGVSGIARLPDGDLWLHGADGIYRVPAASLAAWMRDTRREVDFKRFDALDGLHGHAPQLRPLPSLLRAADGVLWFSTGSAITLADPAAVARNPLAPPVTILGVTAEGRTYPTRNGATLSLPQGASNLTVAFTALSLAMPERVRFRYRLEGVDRGWQEPGARRAASYTNLDPGTYRFRVTAANEDGVWNPAGATLDIRIAPAFVQTVWFALLLALGFAALLYGAYTLRVRYLTRRMRERLHARMEERERIARSLHDTLLQGVQGLVMSFDAHAVQVPPGSRERDHLERGLGLARRLLVEGRNQIMGLRASTSPDEMHVALQSFGAELAAYGGHAFDLRIVGLAQPLKPLVSDEIYAIGHEALLNASRYAGAGHVFLALEYGDDAFALCIRDDGRGLDPEVAAAGSRPGHWGLPGMRERARAIGAQFELSSRPGAGTAIVVTLSAELAYPFSLRRPGRLLSRLFAGLPGGRGAAGA